MSYPFEAYAETNAEDWIRVSNGLEFGNRNTMIIYDADQEIRTLDNPTHSQMRAEWNELFGQHSTIRVLGFDNTFYIEPIANNAEDARANIMRTIRK